MGLVSFIAYLLALSVSWGSNRHLLSPVKLFLALLGMFSFDLFLNEYPIYVHALFLGYLAVAVLSLPAERRRNVGATRCGAASGIDPGTASRAVALIWLFTVIPVGAQLYLIHMAGGVGSYLYNISDRVQLYKGLGYILVFRDSMLVLSLLYWAVYLVVGKRRVSWMPLCVHCSIMFLIALATGSRGTVLWPLVFMVLIYDVARRSVSSRAIAVVVAIVLPAASALGVLRESINRTGEGNVKIEVKQGRSLFQTTSSSYALVPLLLVIPDNNAEPKYGMTFVSALTNFVPRNVWPEKPDTGGVVITQEYLADAWKGRSYISTGIIAESVMNFGRVGGIMFGYAFLFLSLQAISKEYYQLRVLPFPCSMSMGHLARVVFYAMATVAVAGLHTTEFTNCVSSLAMQGMVVFGIARVISLSRASSQLVRGQDNVRVMLARGRQLDGKKQ